MSLEPAVNMLDSAWIPVRMRDGETAEMSLLTMFECASEIEALAESSPTSLVAMYRLLLAITHRALVHEKGRWTDADRARWFRHGLPVDAIRAYLEEWRERFWLFHPRHPFMQVAALAEAEETREKHKPWTQIALASANGNTPVMFDHAIDANPVSIPATEAFRELLGFLQFTPGGLVKVFRGADKAGPLANTAAVLPLGGTLGQTLMLSLHPCTDASAQDRPSWERDPPSIQNLLADPLPATGPCDRYSRLSRAVLLRADDDVCHRVRWIHFGAGLGLAEDPAAPDSMSSYRSGSQGLVRLGFVEGRAAWRDLGALLPDPSGQASQPAAILSWAVNLQMALNDLDGDLSVLLAGLASDQAKLLRWRSEHFRLPVSTLSRADVASIVRDTLQKTEACYRELNQLLRDAIATTLPDPKSKDTRARARELVDRSPLAAVFFSAAEQALPDLLRRVGRSELDGAEQDWARVLLGAIRRTWETALDLLGNSTAALRAQAQCHGRYQRLLEPLRLAVDDPSVNPIQKGRT